MKTYYLKVKQGFIGTFYLALTSLSNKKYIFNFKESDSDYYTCPQFSWLVFISTTNERWPQESLHVDRE